MPWPKGKPRSPETRAKIAKAQTGRLHSDESKAKIGAGNSGKARTPEMRAAVSAGRLAYLATLTPDARAAKARTFGMLGKKHSPETRERMREAQQQRTREGRTGYTPEVGQRISESQQHRWGTMSPEKRAAFSAMRSRLGTGRTHSPETRILLRELAIGRRQWLSAGAKQKSTKPEIAVAQMLTNQGVTFIPQHRLGYWRVDFYLPDTNEAIEVQGCYWHGCEPCGFGAKNRKHRDADARKAAYLTDHGYTVTLIWEHDLK